MAQNDKSKALSDVRATVHYTVPKSKSKFSLPLANRTFERTQGCWNCRNAADVEATLKRWLSHDRPQHDASLARDKQALLEGGMNPKSDLVKKAIAAIEKKAEHIERFERSIRFGDDILGQMTLCTAPLSEKRDQYVSDKFLCDQWSAATGASVARAGQRADDLPEEMMDKHGDGN